MADNRIQGVGRDWRGYGLGQWQGHPMLDQSGVPPYTQWGENLAVFIRAFQNSWLLIAGLTVIAIVASSMRGVDKRQGQGS